MSYNQDAPFTIQIDLTEGCNIRVPRPDGTEGLCWACGLNGIREGVGDYKFMTLETAEELAKQIKIAGWNSQLLFAGFGEPSMNPNVFLIIEAFRRHLPRQYMVMLSNGAKFTKEGMIDSIFDAGINTLAIEDYDGGLGEKIAWPASREVMNYPANKDANPHQRSRKQRLVFLTDIAGETKGTHSVLNNHAGIGLPPRKVKARCAKVFREVAVKWDGHISICCIDWRRETDFGNINHTAIDTIWNNEKFKAARRILLTGERDKIGICSRCDHPSYRIGLLPDKFGKVKLEGYTDADVALIKDNHINRVAIVKRPWEK
jgi:radical SAM protein with 4Fe4S-binding SPASM domain